MERLVYKDKEIEVKSYSRAGEIFCNNLSLSVNKSKELEMFYEGPTTMFLKFKMCIVP